jgi:hypothetical protein
LPSASQDDTSISEGDADLAVARDGSISATIA